MERPDGLTPLGRLAGWPNFRRICGRPPVFVVEDHRAVQQVAWAAQRQGVFGGAVPLLLRFDAHPDMGERPRPWDWEKSRMTDLDAVASLVNDQRTDDGGWVMAAMQLGLAQDVATFFVHDYHRFPYDSEPFIDHTGATHRLWTFANLREHLDGKHARLSRGADAAIDSAPAHWVDIDLDFATRRICDETGAIRTWDESDWAAEFGEREVEWFAACLSRASLVTIATEPEFCGGLGGVGRIAEAFKSRFAGSGEWFATL